MRLGLGSIVIPALALLMLGCGPHMHHHGDPWMDGHHGGWHGCGPEACFYGSHCFSGGAVRSNDGVCQSCSGGKWVAASGCEEHSGCHMCGGHCGGCDHCGGKTGDKSGPCPMGHPGPCPMGYPGPHGPRHRP
jgi:hypothetical protein